MSKTISHVGEFKFIESIRKCCLTSGDVKVGIGDDAAVFKVNSRKRICWTTDMLVEGVHFTKNTVARDIGHKALAVNISDIAAMGGLPKYILVTLGVPVVTKNFFLQEIYRGMNKTAKKYGLKCVGGDTVKSRQMIINVSVIGECDQDQYVTRKGAKPGDQIFVTGPCGRSLESGWHLKFQPRLKEAQILIKQYRPTAMIDISDGLVADLGHIIKESHVGALLYGDLIPKRLKATLHEALYDGEDFELLFTVSSRAAQRLRNQKGCFRFFHIGEITDKKNKIFLQNHNERQRRLLIKGYQHF